MNFAFNVPINSLSLGQTSIALLRELFKKGLSPCVFPIGNVDISAQREDSDFNLWLQSCVNKSFKRHSRDGVNFKLWHISGALDGFCRKQALFTFHECSEPSEEEVNGVKNQDICFVSSTYTKEVFETYGATNVVYAPLGFDSWNFKETNKTYLNPDVILWELIGKRESRKNSDRIAALWVKKFGNNRNHQLNIACFNPFYMGNDGRPLSFEQQVGLFVSQVFNGQRFWNVNFIPYLKTNAEVNDLQNASQITLSGLSGLEGFNLPLLQSLCLGKWAVVLNSHVHRDYCNENNSILVNPNSMRVADDGMFFRKGAPFNGVGNWFDFDNDEVIAAMEKAVDKAHTPNIEGKKLKEKFTWDNTLNIILDNIGKL